MKNLLFTMMALCCSLFSNTLYSQFENYGCTDPAAGNYNPQASIDDGSCCYSNVATVASSQEGYAYISGHDGSYWEYQFPGTYTFCMSEGCYFISAEAGFSEDFNGTVSVDGVALVTWTNLPGMINGFPFSLDGNEAFGCTDAGACNYNANASCENGSCTYDCYGCSDPNALNFDADAQINDGSCCYDISSWYTISTSGPIYFEASSVDGSSHNTGVIEANGGYCTMASCIYFTCYSLTGLAEEITVTAPDGSILYTGSTNPGGDFFILLSTGGEVGCGDSNACNYNPNAYCIDYALCDYSCYGCTDPNAPNYDAEATIDNGTCCSSASWTTITTTLPYVGIYVYSHNGQANFYTTTDENGVSNACLGEGCYELQIIDFLPSLITVTVERNGEILYSQETVGNLGGSFSVNATVGCMDASACNYIPEANCSLGAYCEYGCFGCTDPEADNFDPEATIDNGQCCYNMAYIQIGSNDAYWSVWGYTGGYSTGGYSGGTDSFCLSDGCYTYSISSWSSEPSPFSITDGDGNILASGEIDPIYGYATGQLSVNASEGCIDPGACNYDPLANCPNYSLCTYDCYGCTDSSAPNYNAEATIDNGSCCYENWYTVTTSNEAYWSVYSTSTGAYFSNYNTTSNGFCTDGNCFELTVYTLTGLPIDYSVVDANGNVIASGTTDETGYAHVRPGTNDVFGCTVVSACNYDPNATCPDYNACDFSCFGCTDPSAPNYDANATQEDGTCCYNDWISVSFSEPTYWYAYNYNTGMHFSGSYPYDTGFCASGSCFQIYAWGLTGIPVTYSVTNASGTVLSAGDLDIYEAISISNGDEVAGCTYQDACNYNASATCDDGSCTYYCGGCTDAQALNYNPSSLFNDGSCFYDIEVPMLQFTVQQAEGLDMYYVRTDVMSVGNGAPYLLTSDANMQAMMVEDAGTYLAGPFPCNQDVTLSLHSTTVGFMEYGASSPVVAPCTSTNVNESVNNALLVYPNPSNGMVQISGLNGSTIQLEVFDMTGRTVLSKQVSANGTALVLDLSVLNNGVYQLRTMNGTDVKTTSVVIQK